MNVSNVRKVGAHDFFDPSVRDAQWVGAKMGQMNEEQILAAGGEKFAQIEFVMDAVSTLKSMQRLVRPSAQGKAFADGSVFDAIADERTADVSFYKMPDGSGISVANLSDNSKALGMLFSRLNLNELDLMPKAPVAKTAAPKLATISLPDGQNLNVQLSDAQNPGASVKSVPMRALASRMPINASNPLAIKAFLLEVSNAKTQCAPMDDPADLLMVSIMAATSEAHPSDSSWPDGIRVTDKMSGKTIESPKKAFELFDLALSGKPGEPQMSTDDVQQAFKARRLKA